MSEHALGLPPRVVAARPASEGAGAAQVGTGASDAGTAYQAHRVEPAAGGVAGEDAEALWAVVNATAQGSEEFQVISAVDSDFLRDVSTAYANHDRHSLARAIAIARCGLGEAMQGKLRKDTEQLWAERAHGPAHREERAAAHAADAARGGTNGAEGGGQAHIEEREVIDVCAAEVSTQSSSNEQLKKSQLAARAAAHAADAARGGTGADGTAEAGGQAPREGAVGDICAAEVGTQSSLNEQLDKSQFVALCPSVRQGCPASPLMFLLVSARSGRRTAVMRRPPQRPKRQPAAVRDTAEEDTEQLWAERALGPAHREERAAAHAADAARGGTGTDGAEAGGQAHIEERVVGDICAAEVGTQSSLNEQLNKSQLVALCGSEPEADADAGEEGGTTPRSPPSGAKRGRARWGDEAEGMGGAGPSGLAASDASDPLAAALLDNKPVTSGGESGTPDEALSPQGGLEETMAMSTEQAEAIKEFDQQQDNEATRGLSAMDLGASVGTERAPGHPVLGMD